MLITINLRDFYPWYVTDVFLEVSEEVAAELQADRRYEKNHERIQRRYKVHSLDAEDGTEEAVAMECHSNNPEAVFKMIDNHCRLCCALNTLPKTQGRRVEARYLFGNSVQKIAITESVSLSSIKESIERGIKTMRKVF